MKLRPALPTAAENLTNDFLRGMLSTGLLMAMQQQGLKQPGSSRIVLGRALQGGAALASGVAAANALQQGRTSRALVAMALGAASIAGIECLMHETRTERQ